MKILRTIKQYYSLSCTLTSILFIHKSMLFHLLIVRGGSKLRANFNLLAPALQKTKIPLPLNY